MNDLFNEADFMGNEFEVKFFVRIRPKRLFVTATIQRAGSLRREIAGLGSGPVKDFLAIFRNSSKVHSQSFLDPFDWQI